MLKKTVPEGRVRQHIVGTNNVPAARLTARACEARFNIQRSVIVRQLFARQNVPDGHFAMEISAQAIRPARVVHKSCVIPAKDVITLRIAKRVGIQLLLKKLWQRRLPAGGKDLIECITHPRDGASGNDMRCDYAVANLRVDVLQFRVGMNHCGSMGSASERVSWLNARALLRSMKRPDCWGGTIQPSQGTRRSGPGSTAEVAMGGALTGACRRKARLRPIALSASDSGTTPLSPQHAN